MRSLIPKFLAHLLNNGPLTFQEAAADLDISPDTLYSWKHELVLLGLIHLHSRRPAGNRGGFATNVWAFGPSPQHPSRQRLLDILLSNKPSLPPSSE